MKIMNDSKGMVLVTVLLIIVVFAVVGTLILSFTVNNAKQTKAIEEDMVAVDAAEMGIIRYRNELYAKMEALLPTLIENTVNEFNHTKNGVFTIEDIVKYLFDQGSFNDFLLGYVEESMSLENTDVSYILKEESIKLSGLDLTFNIESTGNSLEKSNIIKASFTFKLGEYFILKNSEESTKSEENSMHISIARPNIDPPYLWSNQIKKANTNSFSLTDNNKNDRNYDELQVDHIRIEINNSNLESKTFKANKSLTFSGNIQGIRNSKLHVEEIDTYYKYELPFTHYKQDIITKNSGIFYSEISLKENKGAIKKNNLVISQLLKGIIGSPETRNSVIYSGDNIVFSGNFDPGANIEYSNLYAGYDMTFTGTFGSKIMGKSILYADHDISFNNNINSSAEINDSVIYAEHDISFDKIFEGKIKENSLVFAGHDVSFKSNINSGAELNNSIIYAKHKVDFNTLGDLKILNKSVIYADLSSYDVFTNIVDGIEIKNVDLSKIKISEDSYFCTRGTFPVNLTKALSNYPSYQKNFKQKISFEECLNLVGKTTKPQISNEIVKTLKPNNIKNWLTESDKLSIYDYIH